jgi:phosphate uptake regulator
MKQLTVAQVDDLLDAVTKLDEADCFMQKALGASEQCEDLHNRIQSILEEIESLIDESEMVDI